MKIKPPVPAPPGPAAGAAPILVGVSVIRHHVRRLAIGYLLGQVYLEPNPKELTLSHHA